MAASLPPILHHWLEDCVAPLDHTAVTRSLLTCVPEPVGSCARAVLQAPANVVAAGTEAEVRAMCMAWMRALVYHDAEVRSTSLRALKAAWHLPTFSALSIACGLAYGVPTRVAWPTLTPPPPSMPARPPPTMPAPPPPTMPAPLPPTMPAPTAAPTFVLKHTGSRARSVPRQPSPPRPLAWRLKHASRARDSRGTGGEPSTSVSTSVSTSTDRGEDEDEDEDAYTGEDSADGGEGGGGRADGGEQEGGGKQEEGEEGEDVAGAPATPQATPQAAGSTLFTQQPLTYTGTHAHVCMVNNILTVRPKAAGTTRKRRPWSAPRHITGGTEEGVSVPAALPAPTHERLEALRATPALTLTDVNALRLRLSLFNPGEAVEWCTGMARGEGRLRFEDLPDDVAVMAWVKAMAWSALSRLTIIVGARNAPSGVLRHAHEMAPPKGPELPPVAGLTVALTSAWHPVRAAALIARNHERLRTVVIDHYAVPATGGPTPVAPDAATRIHRIHNNMRGNEVVTRAAVTGVFFLKFDSVGTRYLHLVSHDVHLLQASVNQQVAAFNLRMQNQTSCKPFQGRRVSLRPTMKDEGGTLLSALEYLAGKCVVLDASMVVQRSRQGRNEMSLHLRLNNVMAPIALRGDPKPASWDMAGMTFHRLPVKARGSPRRADV